MPVPLSLALVLALMTFASAAEDPVAIPLRNHSSGGAEGAQGEEKVKGQAEGSRKHRYVSNIHNPSITPFLPEKGKGNGAAVVILPGGGHQFLSIDHEGFDFARYLASQGIAGFVLKYRLAHEPGSHYKVEEHALADACRAIRLVRSRASEWGLDPRRVGLVGFSAGGELALLEATQYPKEDASAPDPIDRVSARPDFLALIYPGSLRKEFAITKETPAAFLAVADDDVLCLATTLGVHQQLKKAKVSAELHVYAKGGHGFGVDPRPLPITGWPARLVEWMNERGFTKRPSADPGQKPGSAPAAGIHAPAGFQVDLIYSVPKDTQGSWVNMCVDPKGRLIVSDQYGKLYRVTLPPIDAKSGELRIEPIDIPLGEAHGLLWAFDSLYVMVNHGRRYDSGLYRVLDTNGDDQLDKVEVLRKLNGGGEHGPHAVVLAPDGQSLYVVAGNATQLPDLDGSLVPKTWGEDNLLPRMVDGAGFMTDEKAPGGFICKVSPDGKRWELVSMGYRNPFDIAFNSAGDLFAYDSDMEWDMNMPWYRPTRVLHSVSGSEFGYRNGAGKWPAYAIDSLPAAVNVGPGSPTGIAFGYRAAFPVKYREALFICDWSYGKLYAVHLGEKGSSYTGELEEFLAGTPLPLTDIVVNPHDGAMYFTVGGRQTQSGLYRVTYSGADGKAQEKVAASDRPLRDLRRSLESFHGRRDSAAVARAWPHLGHEDRFIRWAARVAIEFQDPAEWRDRALAEKSSPEATLNALLALVHVSAKDPAHRREGDPEPDPELRDKVLRALAGLDWDRLAHPEKLDLLRLYQVTLNRFGKPGPDAVARLIGILDPRYPASSREMNNELCQLLVYLEAPAAAAKTVALLERAPTQEEQLAYGSALRVLKTGWTAETRKAYFTWIYAKSPLFRGGNSLRGFLAKIKGDALANLSDSDKVELKPIMDAPPPKTVATNLADRPFVKSYTLEELTPLVDAGLKDRDFDKGRSLFAAAKCFACHRFNNEGGGAGPDLTGAAGRFSRRDLLESIIAPSKTISDQYQAVMIATNNGRVVTGRIVNLQGDRLMVSADMLDPNNMVSIRRDEIDEIKPSPVSLMPEGLLSTLQKEEVLDLMAYLLSRGDRESSMFKKRADGG